jgi:hypothetical protein
MRTENLFINLLKSKLFKNYVVKELETLVLIEIISFYIFRDCE